MPVFAVWLPQTVFNTMCGYETQSMEESEALEDIFIIGCLDKIVRWGKNNLLLVGGITVGLLCLEVRPVSHASLRYAPDTDETSEAHYR